MAQCTNHCVLGRKDQPGHRIKHGQILLKLDEIAENEGYLGVDFIGRHVGISTTKVTRTT